MRAASSQNTPSEKEAIEQKPTADLVAHDLYIRRKRYIDTSAFSTRLVESLSEAVRLLNQAIQRDPPSHLPITNSPGS